MSLSPEALAVAAEQAAVLAHALPFLRRYAGATIVVKYGGHAMGDHALAEQFGKSSLPAAAKQVVLITASVENGCEYCVAAHSTLALRARVPAEVVEALRAGPGEQLLDGPLAGQRAVLHA